MAIIGKLLHIPLATLKDKNQITLMNGEENLQISIDPLKYITIASKRERSPNPTMITK